MSKTHTRGLLKAAALALAGLIGLGSTAVSAAVTVESVPVRFTVQNTNTSLSPCLTDNKTYTIRGHLVGPRTKVRAANIPALTVYQHGIGWGEFYWHLRSLPAYDYASQMASLGHVSLVYDQLGYGGSGRPLGLLNCYGGEADITRQIIEDLRAGTYVVEAPRAAPKAQRVALASHQAAGLISQPAAYSYPGIDALVITGWADAPPVFSPNILVENGLFLTACALGGQKSDGLTGPAYYSYFPTTDASFRSLTFSNAAPEVVNAAAALRGRASCGEPLSAVPTVGVDNLQILLRSIKTPVLLVNGLDDKYFMQPLGGNIQKLYYGGSGDVSAEFIAGAGQALTLERSAPEFRRVMHTWLAARGY